ncbi:hypothetical protein C900_03313 [Fulvivirga imtechensis AK7]|uniref:Uncharacterized protein n=1 Tax=Fulvivirga imtechensis AK7 TaxID=1237149 RepID=L8JRQ8_9BACT|nr:hypothetical protein C900_03313 [Fulvivirga imtechensis AK7]
MPLNKKLAAYQTGIIIKAAILEAPALLACVVTFITGKIVILGVVPLVLFVFFIHRPTLYRLESDLELSRDDLEKLKSGIS